MCVASLTATKSTIAVLTRVSDRWYIDTYYNQSYMILYIIRHDIQCQVYLIHVSVSMYIHICMHAVYMAYGINMCVYIYIYTYTSEAQRRFAEGHES